MQSEAKKEQEKKKVHQLYQKEKIKRETDEILNKKIGTLLNSEDTKNFFAKHKNQLNFIFDFLRKNVELDKSLNFSPNHLQYKAFLYFTFYFGLIENVLTPEEIQLIYRSTSKDVKLKERIPIGFLKYFFIFTNLRNNL